MSFIDQYLLKNNLPIIHKLNITTVTVSSPDKGLKLAQDFLYFSVDSKTVLFLSGGKTPKELYFSLAEGKAFKPGLVALVDERYGKKLHEDSNELLIKNSNLLKSLEYQNVPFCSILQEKKLNRQETAEKYDEMVRFLLHNFTQSLAVLGVGMDGHTAGIAGNRNDFKNPLFEPSQKNLYVGEFNDEKGMFKERITMTFLALSMIDVLLVLVFGEDKKKVLELMFKDGSEEEIPARFFKRPEIAAKTLFITDQKV